MASVRGTVWAKILSREVERLEVGWARLAPVDGAAPFMEKAISQGRYEFLEVPPRWYILSIFSDGFGETVRAIHVVEGANEMDRIDIRYTVCAESAESIMCRCEDDFFRAHPVLSVREALEARTISHCLQEVVIVGIFKSGIDESLRLDCPFQRVTGEVGWPSSIGLTGALQPPSLLREKVEKKRQEILNSAQPGARPHPERVMGFYGFLGMPLGLTSAPCCSAAIETTFPPARLCGVGAQDLRVIR